MLRFAHGLASEVLPHLPVHEMVVLNLHRLHQCPLLPQVLLSLHRHIPLLLPRPLLVYSPDLEEFPPDLEVAVSIACVVVH